MKNRKKNLAKLEAMEGKTMPLIDLTDFIEDICDGWEWKDTERDESDVAETLRSLDEDYFEITVIREEGSKGVPEDDVTVILVMTE